MTDDFVTTLKGNIARAELDIKLIEGEDNQNLYVAREYYWHGELVRRDAFVSIKRGVSAEAKPGEL